MDLEYPNPIDSEQRLKHWPAKHDIGLFLSTGDTLMLVGTAADHEDLRTLFHALAHEWARVVEEDPDWVQWGNNWFFEEDIT